MKNLSSKRALLLILAAVVLSSCIAPVGGLQAFYDDEIIDQYIDKTFRARVYVDEENSDDDLIGGDRRITGLDPFKYYMVVQELDANGEPVIRPYPWPMYVTDYNGLGPGGLINDLGYITRIKGKAITGLTNFNTYTVKSAAWVGNMDLSYTDDSSDEKTVEVKDGKATISSDEECTLDLSGLFTVGDNIKYIAVPFPVDTREKQDDYEQKSLGEAPTQSIGIVDYVFAEVSNIWNFKVLQVIIEAVPQGTLHFELAPGLKDEFSLINGGTISISSSNGLDKVNLSFDDDDDFDNIKWYINGDHYDSADDSNSLEISNSDDFEKYMVVGKVKVTVEAEKNSKTWGAVIEITITK